jgi:hypothetical protein
VWLRKSPTRSCYRARVGLRLVLIHVFIGAVPKTEASPMITLRYQRDPGSAARSPNK